LIFDPPDLTPSLDHHYSVSHPPPSIRSHPLPAVRPEFVRLSNLIAGHSRLLAFQWNARTVELSFSALGATARGSWTLGLELDGHAMQMVLSRLPDIAWISPTLAGIDLQDLPEELACGLIESCFGEIIDALAKQGIAIRMTFVSPFSARDTPTECLEWALNRGDEKGWMHGHLLGEDEALNHLAALMQKVPAKARPTEEDLPIQVQFVAGDLRLALAELRRLSPHDVLLGDGKAFLKQRLCQVYAGSRRLGEATLHAHTCTLTHLNPAPTAMEETHNSPPIHDFNDLEIHLTFSVGSVNSTVGTLRGMAPGYVFELPQLAGDGVSILANGKVIGKGEWIEVGDRTGIRVTELYSA
jgi:type III secretion protein Q